MWQEFVIIGCSSLLAAVPGRTSYKFHTCQKASTVTSGFLKLLNTLKTSIKTIIITSLQLFSVIFTAKFITNKEPFLLIPTTVLCCIYLYFEYQLFRNKAEIAIALTITFVTLIVGFLLNTLPEFIATPFLMILIIIAARNIFLKITNVEPATVAKGYALTNQRDRIYSWTIINVLWILISLTLLKPWIAYREKTIWIPLGFLLFQLPIILIAFLIQKGTKKRSVKR